MSRKRLVVVGGVAAGASAAAKARRTSEELDIVIFEAGPYISFANCGLPYYVGQEINRRERLFVTDRVGFSRRFGIDVRVRTRVLSVNPADQSVRVVDDEGSEETVAYDRLVLATGTVAIQPPIPGLDRPNIFTVRTVPDVDSIVSHLDELAARPCHPEDGCRALVMGGGYIGLETAEQLARLGLKVTVVEKAPQVMSGLDPEVALQVRHALESEGVEVILGDGISEVVEGDGTTVARTESGRELPFDIGLQALGVRPNVQLARDAGIDLGSTGAIKVDSRQRTSIPGIYAAGDNCEVNHLVLGQPVNIPLAGPANKMGRVAGANAALDLLNAPETHPERLSFSGVLGTAVVRVCDCLAAVTGLNERSARQYGVPYEIAYMFGSSNAGYYPNAEPLFVKVLYDPDTGRLLGAQGVGGKGVDKRVDVLATAIAGRMTVEDLEQLDLCYAPPVGSAKDVPIMVGFAGANIRRAVMPAITPFELMQELDGEQPPFVLDVRTPPEYSEGHLDVSVNIPLDELRGRLDEVPRDRDVVVHCRSGYRSYVAQRILLNLGWDRVRNVQGGFLLINLVRTSGMV
jgi:NADPH-dependent 2,4-dienoyl-CoA reductase/sulfur reductase-like enzyme/rhodanese-related sulfurtransferase